MFLGLYVIIPKVWLCLEGVAKVLGAKRFLLKPKFKGEKQWAVVTGCTAGIGEEITYRLAEEGFNIVLISRSADKLAAVATKIASKGPGIETKII